MQTYSAKKKEKKEKKKKKDNIQWLFNKRNSIVFLGGCGV